MSGYVIVRIEDGAFVAPSGSASSYTRALQDARVFASREQAERERCGNERVMRLEDTTRREE
jgi:hypothetical protein